MSAAKKDEYIEVATEDEVASHWKDGKRAIHPKKSTRRLNVCWSTYEQLQNPHLVPLNPLLVSQMRT